MSGFFDQIERDMRGAVRQHRHLPWYIRLLKLRHARGLTLVLAALVVATPAVGAATQWFGLGAPDRFPAQPAGLDAGRALAGTSQLLGLRVADPQGGPPWGLRLVHTTRGDACLQLGRVEEGRLGSLGIDDAWNNDHLFHPFPTTSQGDDCGTTDAAGNGFVNIAYSGMIASANPTAGARGPQAGACRPPLLMVGRMAARHPSPGRSNGLGSCPADSSRFVFEGLLGPDATSITYEAPSGRLLRRATAGSDGAYLLVFPLNRRTCELYTQGPTGGYGPCGGTVSQGGPSPDAIGAVKAITYRDGHTCSLDIASKLLTEYQTFMRGTRDHIRQQRSTTGPSPAEIQTIRRRAEQFLAVHHATPAQLRQAIRPYCPPVGYLAPHERHLTAADVVTPLHVQILPPAYNEFQVEITFTARQAAHGSASWYEDYFTNPPGCPSSGQGGQIGFGNTRAGQVIHDRRLIGSCKGTYHGLIGYMQNSGPIDQNSSGGGMPGHDGSLVVGHITFTVH
jgi:hypothetical protein